MTPQERMDEAFDNYFEISDILTSDMMYLLDLDDADAATPPFRRLYIRNLAAMVEGISHSYRSILSVQPDMWSYYLTKKETNVLTNESSFSVVDRIKYTLRATYKILELDPKPDFGGQDWDKAIEGLDKRGAIMHPKSVADLDISFNDWIDMQDGLVWLTREHFRVMELVHKRNVERGS